MSYKSILVHVDETKSSLRRIHVAHQIAKLFEAHITAIAVTGISRYILESSDLYGGDPNISFHIGALKDHAKRAILKFNEEAKSLVGISTEAVIADDEANGGLGLRARYCDLIIIGQTNRAEPTASVMNDFPEFMVVHSGRPILIIPHTGQLEHIGIRPLIAWDGSKEAARAISDALPMLKTSQKVYVLIVNPNDPSTEHGEEPGADIALFLARHNIPIEVVSRNSAHDTGTTILETAKELNCDLLVMGGYGHSRFREMILGGVTKTVLEKTQTPVLMSH